MNGNLNRFEDWLRVDLGLSENTVAAYAADVKQCLEVLDCEARAVTAGDLRTYLSDVQAGGVSARSRARKLAALKQFFAFLVLERVCAENPARDLEAVVPARRLPDTMTADEVERLLQAPVRERPLEALMLRTLYATGMRVSELVSLEAAQVDLKSGVVRVKGKGGRMRVIPLDGETVRLLLGYQKTRDTRTKQFFTQNGRPFTRQALWGIVKRNARAAEIEREISPHTLRHAFATHLLERGMGLRTLQMLLGHQDISTTEIYSHITNSHLRETLRKFHPRSK